MVDMGVGIVVVVEIVVVLVDWGVVRLVKVLFGV